MEPPEEWPFVIKEKYDPIRVLGTGGFASVVLARDKTSEDKKNKAAIKVVGGIHDDGSKQSAAEIKQERDKAVLYARREIEILKNLQHPGINQLLDSWVAGADGDEKNGGKSSLTAAVLVLGYVRGPTVESLLKHGGALSTQFGRVVIAQTMDAISYLHGHAILHRDIKPDNIIVSGALSKDDFIWDNPEDGDDSLIPSRRQPDWAMLRSKYKVTLIDFGFARALTPEDVAKPSRKSTLEDSKLASYHRLATDKAYKGGDCDELGSSHRSTRRGSIRRQISQGLLDSSRHRMLRHRPPKDDLGMSASRRIKRTMSALGNRMFAAPEIINQVRTEYRPRTDPKLGKSEQSKATTDTISNYVADYGLLVDAYSMGHTIRYMMTGVQPGISVEDAIVQQNGGFLGQLFSMCFKKKENPQDRSVRYRRMEDLPNGVRKLIGSMTQTSTNSRLSIRKARWNVPWVFDVLESENPQSEDRITYLSATKRVSTVRESDVSMATTVVDFSGKTADQEESSEAPLSF